MDTPRDRLAWLALLVVDEAAEAGAKGPVAPALGLRLALAYLYSIADGPIFALPSRRHVFDRFWAEVTRPIGPGTPYMEHYSRHTHIEGCLRQIGRQIGQGENAFNPVREFRRRAASGQAVLNVADERGLPAPEANDT